MFEVAELKIIIDSFKNKIEIDDIIKLPFN